MGMGNSLHGVLAGFRDVQPADLNSGDIFRTLDFVGSDCTSSTAQ